MPWILVGERAPEIKEAALLSLYLSEEAISCSQKARANLIQLLGGKIRRADGRQNAAQLTADYCYRPDGIDFVGRPLRDHHPKHRFDDGQLDREPCQIIHSIAPFAGEPLEMGRGNPARDAGFRRPT